MTPPRHNLPGTTWLVTRRCSERRFFLKPGSFVGQAILFILGYALNWFGLQLHAIAVLSNHWHVVVTDVRGKKSEFFQFVHSMIGRSVNAFRGRFEAFWAPGRPNMVRLVTREDILDKIVYVILNPVRADLVEKASDWPGLVTLPRHFVNTEFRTQRPGRFFNRRGPLGEVTVFRLTKPPGFEHLTEEEFAAALARRVEAGEKALAEARGKKRVLGAKSVISARYSSRPKKRAPQFERHPHIACRDPELRAAALEELQRFWSEHRTAVGRFSKGARNALFPAGTLLMRKRFRVRCRPPQPPPGGGFRLSGESQADGGGGLVVVSSVRSPAAPG